MKTLPQILIPALWLVWIAYWIVAARGVKQTHREESLRSRATHHVPLLLGAVMIAVPGVLGPTLEQFAVAPGAATRWSAVALIAIGLGFAAAARVWLADNWSATVTVKQGHELVRSGPYALVRHPIYTGLILALAGSALAVGRWRALIGLVLIVAAILRKVAIEERFMAEEFGASYRRYREEVPALVPFLL